VVSWGLGLVIVSRVPHLCPAPTRLPKTPFLAAYVLTVLIEICGTTMETHTTGPQPSFVSCLALHQKTITFKVTVSILWLWSGLTGALGRCNTGEQQPRDSCREEAMAGIPIPQPDEEEAHNLRDAALSAYSLLSADYGFTILNN
jgi:hypothetical protein